MVIDAAGTLVTEGHPRYIFMQTCDPDLPPKAVAKYERVLETFSGLGYEIEEQLPYHGRLSWWMERRDA
jgi:hypothetical protein